MVSTDSDAVKAGSTLPVTPESPSNVLLLSESLDGHVDDACGELVSETDPESTDLLVVSLLGSIDARIGAYRAAASSSRLPAKVAFVTSGDGTRSAAAARTGTSSLLADDETQFATTSVSDPGDLTGIGMKVSRCLDSWTDDGNQTVVCFHSLTVLVQYVGLQKAFQFLHVLTSRIEAAGAIAHFHLDPSACDDRTVATLRSLFDVVLVSGEDGWEEQ